MKPTPAKPRISIAQVAGSGTGVTTSSETLSKYCDVTPPPGAKMTRGLQLDGMLARRQVGGEVQRVAQRRRRAGADEVKAVQHDTVQQDAHQSERREAIDPGKSRDIGRECSARPPVVANVCETPPPSPGAAP